MEEINSLISSVATPLLVALISWGASYFYFKRKSFNSKIDVIYTKVNKQEECNDLNARINIVLLKAVKAIMDALKHGYANGNVKEAEEEIDKLLLGEVNYKH
jgi:hypothetical protein